MIEINIGDRVRIKDRLNWPSPPGYKLANSEGKVIQVGESEKLDDGLIKGFVVVQLEKTKGDFPIGTQLTFRSEFIEKI